MYSAVFHFAEIMKEETLKKQATLTCFGVMPTCVCYGGSESGTVLYIMIGRIINSELEFECEFCIRLGLGLSVKIHFLIE